MNAIEPMQKGFYTFLFCRTYFAIFFCFEEVNLKSIVHEEKANSKSEFCKQTGFTVIIRFFLQAEFLGRMAHTLQFPSLSKRS